MPWSASTRKRRETTLTALLTLLAFGCATARQQPAIVQTAQAPPPRVALAEPVLELWMEGTRPVDPQESARALEQGREALSRALEGRGLDDVSDPEQLLVVRARAIARTEERKSAQVWSAVGIVVVIVGIVIAAVVLSRSKSSSGGSRGSRPALPAGTRGAPFARPHRVVPRPYVPPPIGVSLGFNVVVPVVPIAPVPYADPVESRLESRGWFDGDEVELTLELADPRTGAVSWQRTVREGIDPRDEKALTALVDRALADMPFGHRQVARAAAGGVLHPLPPEASAAPPQAGGEWQKALKLRGSRARRDKSADGPISTAGERTASPAEHPTASSSLAKPR
jgi:hypothetical protein